MFTFCFSSSKERNVFSLRRCLIDKNAGIKACRILAFLQLGYDYYSRLFSFGYRSFLKICHGYILAST